MSNFTQKMKQILIMALVMTASIGIISPVITIAVTEDKTAPVVTARTTSRRSKNGSGINF